MAFISVSGEPGCRSEELASLIARKLNCELVTDAILDEMMLREFGRTVPGKAWADAVTSLVATLGTRKHVVVSAIGSEMLFDHFAGVLRVQVTAPQSRRTGDLMVDRRIDRAEARRVLKQIWDESAACQKARFGSARSRPDRFDLILNAESYPPEQMLGLVELAAALRQIFECGLLSASAEAQIQFRVRLNLAKFGLVPANLVHHPKREFGHPSEEIFANLLDFYRVGWEYEPRSFPLQWDASGKVLEAFTPDFYLPEFDLYVELTTMKQALVTRKNRKIRLLRAIYPHINIQVFYQKDLQELVTKYGLTGKVTD